ncbi:MAG TPA: hypothetical protein VF066_12020 [Thermoleophilaceae bacterium]
MEKDVTVERVDVNETRNKNQRYVLRDSDGNEYTTFRPPIGEQAKQFAGKRAHITFHEEERNGFTNVYLDGIAPAASGSRDDGDDGQDAEEAAWQTAVEAAPWLIGKREPDEGVDPDELFDKLKPFQERVASDIRDDEPGSE